MGLPNTPPHGSRKEHLPRARSALLHNGVDDTLGDVDDDLAKTRAAAVELAARDALVAVIDPEQVGHARVVGMLEPPLQRYRGIDGLGRRVGFGAEGRDRRPTWRSPIWTRR